MNLLSFGLQAQRIPYYVSSENLIQMKGVISSGNIGVIPFASVRVKNKKGLVTANNTGFYALVVCEKDTVVFTATGFKTKEVIVPQSPENTFTYHANLKIDTLVFNGGTIYPWPDKDAFKREFLALKLKDDYGTIARRNLEQQTLNDIAASMPRDGRELSNMTLMEMQNSLYYSGGQRNYFMMGGSVVPTSLLNPFAWAEFIKSIQRGDYKKKEKKKKKYLELK